MATKRTSNTVRAEAFDAYGRGDKALGDKLFAEYVHMVKNPKVKSKPVSLAAKARRRAFSNLYGRNG